MPDTAVRGQARDGAAHSAHHPTAVCTGNSQPLTFEAPDELRLWRREHVFKGEAGGAACRVWRRQLRELAAAVAPGGGERAAAHYCTH